MMKPLMLTKQTRRKLLVALALVFFIAAAIILFYAEGWRLDIAHFSVSKVGAMYIRSYPSDAAITIDGVPSKNDSWLLSKGTFISNLFPKNYRLALAKNGYMPWHETISVAPALVAEIDHAILIPKDAKPVPIAGVAATDHFWLTENGILTGNASGTLSWNGQKVSGNAPIGPDTRDTQLVTQDAARGTYTLHDVTGNKNINLNTYMIKYGIDVKRAQLTQSGGKLLVITATRISRWDIGKILAQDSTAEDVSIMSGRISQTLGGTFDPGTAHVATTQFYIAWNVATRDGSVIATYDPFLEKLVGSPLKIPGENAELVWSANNTLGILQTNGGLYTFVPSSGVFDKIASDVVSFFWGPDGTNIAALEHSALEVFLPGNTDVNYYRFRLQDAAHFRRLVWYEDATHLFLVGNNSIAFLDFDDRSLENLIPIENAREGQYDLKTNTLYFLRDSSVMQIAFPT